MRAAREAKTEKVISAPQRRGPGGEGDSPGVLQVRNRLSNSGKPDLLKTEGLSRDPDIIHLNIEL